MEAAETSDRDRVVITGMVPIPDVGEGAPRYTSRDVEAIEEAARKIEKDAAADLRICRPPFKLGDRAPRGCIPGSLKRDDLIACEVEYAMRTANLAGKAAKATEAAEETRRAAARREVAIAVVEAAELTRQAAVNEMQKMRQRLLETRATLADVLNERPSSWGTVAGPSGLDEGKALRNMLLRREAGWGVALGRPDALPGLSIHGVRATQFTDARKGEFVRVEGEIRNSGAKAAQIPGLAAALVDDRGFALATHDVEPAKKGSIPAGRSRTFSFDMQPAPEAMENAVVTFASGAAPPPRIRINGLICPRTALFELQ